MIRTIKLKQFGRFVSYRLDLNSAVTAITGPNGSGKSTLLEAIMYGVWGLQRRKLTRPGTAIQVLDENNEYILRTETEAGNAVSLNGKAKTTKTKATELISERYGAPAAWKQCLYINNKTVARFSQSRPAELKILIQDMLQSKELQQRRVQLTELSKGLKDVAAGKGSCAKTQEQRVRAIKTVMLASATSWAQADIQGPYKELQVKLKQAEDAMNKAAEAHKIAKERSKGASRDEFRLFYYDMPLLNPINLKKELDNASRSVSSDTAGYNCTNCGASISNALSNAKRKEVLDRAEAVRRLDVQHDLFASFLASENLKSAKDDYDNAKRQLDLVANNLQRYIKDSEKLFGLFEQFCKEVAQHDADAYQHAIATNEALVSLDAVEICTQAQAIQLQRVMQQVAAYANSYLAAISAPFKVQMDDSGIVVCSERGTQNYESLSAGEARRVDVCLCLAAAMVSAEVGSLPLNAPVIIDEAFDTLDAAGIESILNLLYEVAKTRQVILVTHADVTFATSGELTHIRL